jgi:hypothetical protein
VAHSKFFLSIFIECVFYFSFSSMGDVQTCIFNAFSHKDIGVREVIICYYFFVGIIQCVHFNILASSRASLMLPMSVVIRGMQSMIFSFANSILKTVYVCRFGWKVGGILLTQLAILVAILLKMLINLTQNKKQGITYVCCSQMAFYRPLSLTRSAFIASLSF